MVKPVLYYFDEAFGRGESIRIAFLLSGIDYEDRRISKSEWQSTIKKNAPYSTVPFLKIDGFELGQCTAILAYIGRRSNLLPSSVIDCATAIEVVSIVEDVFVKARLVMEGSEIAYESEIFVAESGAWKKRLEDVIKRNSPRHLCVGEVISIADISVYTLFRCVQRGHLGKVPDTLLDDCVGVNEVVITVASHPKVIEWEMRN